MMLCPEFLSPRARGPPRPPRPRPRRPPRPARRRPGERIAGTMQYVYGAGPAYLTQVEQHEAPAPVEAPQPERVAQSRSPARASRRTAWPSRQV